MISVFIETFTDNVLQRGVIYGRFVHMSADFEDILSEGMERDFDARATYLSSDVVIELIQ